MPIELRRDAGEYLPTNPQLFRRMMRRSGVEPGDFTFIDLGCGKGRVLIEAAAYRFKAIVGVEADRALFQAAKDNLARFGGGKGRIRLIHHDARTVALPDGNLLIFMYSPFRGAVFAAVAERLAKAAAEPGRALVIAYSSDKEAAVLERTGRFTRERMRRLQFWAPSTVSFFYNDAAMRLRR